VLARQFFPGWECWFWIDQTVPESFINLIEQQPDCRLIMQDSTKFEWKRLLWRFLTAEDPQVDTMIVRDTDSRLGKREQFAVEQWIQAGTDFHIMRDHPRHSVPMLGGMWGCQAHAVRNIRNLISDYYLEGRQHQIVNGIDQDFLGHAIWPLARKNSTLHDSNLEGFPFPSCKRDESNYVGRPYYPEESDWQSSTPRLTEKRFANSQDAFVKGGEGQQRDKLIVFFNKMYDQPIDLDRFVVPGVRFSDDRTLAPMADAVVVHAPQANQAFMQFKYKPLGQAWVSWSLESDVNHPLVNDPRFDLKMTYQSDAEVWIPYFQPYGIELLADIVQPVPDKEPGCVVAAFCSSVIDKSGRLEYLYELSQHIDVHHYGKFMRNQYLDEDTGPKTKLGTFRRYKFAIAFENSIVKDYVTEKFYDPLIAGTIPVYLGAPNIADYAPGKDCYINVGDFKDPADLAAYLRRVDEDDALWQRLLRWKQKALRPEFVSQVRAQAELPHPFVRLAQIIKQRNVHAGSVTPIHVGGWALNTVDQRVYLIRGNARLGVALDEISALIWQLSDGTRTFREIEELLIATYPRAAGHISQDLLETLRKLQYAGAIELTVST